MALEVYLREGETQDALLRRFLKTIQMSGILREAKSRRYFISRGDTARIKAKNSARKRHQTY